ncbi:MAG: hypothetical protein GC164_06685 [Phycisphaera sp.]|nr:hypothetical protein [Phycisphaera sp.]
MSSVAQPSRHTTVTRNTTPEEPDLWLPPRRMRRYQLAKVGGALVVTLIFVGWLVLQWSNPAMRYLTLALLAITLWVTLASILGDLARSRGRQLRIAGGKMTVKLGEQLTTISLEKIFRGQWREDAYDTAGLWLIDQNGATLAHLDTGYLADQDEARAFLRWARQRAKFDFPIQWPT